MNARASQAGGLGVWHSTGETFVVSGNRVESKLRSLLHGPRMVCFDNTDFEGRLLNLLPGYDSRQVSLPTGEQGTLLLNKGAGHVVVDTDRDAASNGRNLLAAYARARMMRPNGSALSSSNRATVLLFAGTYSVADSALVLDTACVDLAGVGPRANVRIESEGNTLVQTVDDVRIENLALHCNSTAPRTLTSADKAAYFPQDNLTRTVMRDVVFSGSNNGLPMRVGITYGGYYENCISGDRSWGGPGHFFGTAINCAAGALSFASGGLFNGLADRCQAGEQSFGAGGFHGTAKNCSAGHNSFGGSGHMVRCEVAGAVNPITPSTGRMTDCHIGPAPQNDSAVVIGHGATLYNCSLIADPAGTGFSVEARQPVSARIAHCRLNRGMRNVSNAIQSPSNIEDLTLD